MTVKRPTPAPRAITPLSYVPTQRVITPPSKTPLSPEGILALKQGKALTGKDYLKVFEGFTYDLMFGPKKPVYQPQTVFVGSKYVEKDSNLWKMAAHEIGIDYKDPKTLTQKQIDAINAKAHEINSHNSQIEDKNLVQPGQKIKVPFQFKLY